MSPAAADGARVRREARAQVELSIIDNFEVLRRRYMDTLRDRRRQPDTRRPRRQQQHRDQIQADMSAMFDDVQNGERSPWRRCSLALMIV